MRVLICDRVHPILIEGLRSKGFDIEIFEQISQSELKRIISNYQGVIVNTRNPIDKIVLDHALELRCVARLGSGKEILDIQELNRRNIKIITTPEANCNAVAEQALGMILSLFRKVPKSNAEVKDFIWNRESNRGTELKGKTIGIIGYGYTGKRFTHLLSSFNCKILVYDKFYRPESHLDFVEVVSDIESLSDSDIISFHVSYLPENKYLFNNDFINTMKKPFYLINTSRGMVVNTTHLIEGLENGKVLGACLDVFENEQVNTYNETEFQLYQKLFSFPNIIVSPHIAGWTVESKENIARSILEQWPDNQYFNKNS